MFLLLALELSMKQPVEDYNKNYEHVCQLQKYIIIQLLEIMV